MKITSITVARLFNLGNFEHARFEFGMELEGENAGTAFHELAALIEALNPKPPHEAWSVKSALSCVAEEQGSDADCAEEIGHAQRILDDMKAWREKRAEAIRALNEFGTETCTNETETEVEP